MPRPPRLACLTAALACAIASCGGNGSAPLAATRARFDPAARDGSRHDFFGLPHPSDLRKTAAGIDLAGFPNPSASSLLGEYLGLLRADGPGFAAAGALYATFNAAIDPASLPADPAATTADGAAVFVVDLDGAASARFPLRLRYTEAATLFLPVHALAALPLYGVPFAAGHRHAFVITTAVRDASGHAIGADAALQRALGLSAQTAADAEARGSLAPFVDWARKAGFDLHQVALASVFMVQDAAAPIVGLRRGVLATPAPTATDLVFKASTAQRHLFTGHLPIPSFQEGAAPYLSSGGRLIFGSDGTAVAQKTESVRFMLSIPRGPAPAGGFPTVLYAHGTGGSYLSAACEGIDALLAARGIATLGIDQVVHGPRNPGCTEPAYSANGLCVGNDGGAYESCVGTAYFNLVNAYAGRDNTRQGAADLFQLIRLVPAVSVSAALHPEGVAASLNAAKVSFLGHSQGGLTGTPFVAAEPGLKGAVLSGTGGTLAITVLQRIDPLNFKALAELLIGIDGRESLDEFHPVLMLIQTAGEPADPLSYASHLVKAPLVPGSKHVMLTEGLQDRYTVADASEALGAAASFDLGGIAAHQSAGFVARGLKVLSLPIEGNVDTEDGPKTGVLLQYPLQGHFAIFEDPTAQCRYLEFLKSTLTTGAGRVEATCTPR